MGRAGIWIGDGSLGDPYTFSTPNGFYIPMEIGRITDPSVTGLVLSLSQQYVELPPMVSCCEESLGGQCPGSRVRRVAPQAVPMWSTPGL